MLDEEALGLVDDSGAAAGEHAEPAGSELASERVRDLAVLRVQPGSCLSGAGTGEDRDEGRIIDAVMVGVAVSKGTAETRGFLVHVASQGRPFDHGGRSMRGAETPSVVGSILLHICAPPSGIPPQLWRVGLAYGGQPCTRGGVGRCNRRTSLANQCRGCPGLAGS